MDCEVGDWADLSLFPSEQDGDRSHQQLLYDYDEANKAAKVALAKEWIFKKDLKDGQKVWLCVETGRCE